jgi:hypothetical protein
MRRQVRHPHPREDQKPGIVGEEPNVAASGLGAPADEAIARAEGARRRSPREAGHGAVAGDDEIFQVLADGLGHIVPTVSKPSQCTTPGILSFRYRSAFAVASSIAPVNVSCVKRLTAESTRFRSGCVNRAALNSPLAPR